MSTVTKIDEYTYRTGDGVEFAYIVSRNANELEMSFDLDHYMLFDEPTGEEVEEWLRSFECGLTEEEIEDLRTLTDNIFDN